MNLFITDSRKLIWLSSVEISSDLSASPTIEISGSFSDEKSISSSEICDFFLWAEPAFQALGVVLCLRGQVRGA